MTVYLFMYLSCLIYLYGFRTTQSSDPCLAQQDKRMCYPIPAQECLFTSNRTIVELEVTHLEIIDSSNQFLEVHWTYASERRFLVRTIPVSNITYQKHLQSCIVGRLLENSVSKTMSGKDKILNYSTRIPLVKNITAYIVDIGEDEVIKRAVRLYVLIPPQNKIISPIVVVRISQNWARLVVFERAQQSASINYQCTKVLCGSESLTVRNNGSNWHFDKCGGGSVPCNASLRAGKPTCIELEEGQMYQIYIDSTKDTIHHELLITPVFGRNVNAISEEKVLWEDYSENAWDFCHQGITSPEAASFSIGKLRGRVSNDASDEFNAGIIVAVIVTATLFATIIIAVVVVTIRVKRTGQIPLWKTLDKAICLYCKSPHPNVTDPTQTHDELNDVAATRAHVDNPGSFAPLLNSVTRKDVCLKVHTSDNKLDESCSLDRNCSSEDINTFEKSGTLQENIRLAVLGLKSTLDLFIESDQLLHINGQKQKAVDDLVRVQTCTSDNISTRTLSNISIYSSHQQLANTSCHCVDIVPPEPVGGNITWQELNNELISINKLNV